ncbi:MAG: histidinol-phosphate transaminase [Chloroflexi bacterium]|nr:histidinol-phosphate transaminase [Chloroflexota bacterium]
MKDSIPFADYVGGRVRSLAEYAPEPTEVIAQRLGMPTGQLIKLDANENPYGPTRHTQLVLNGYSACQYYPDPLSRRLRTAIGRYLHVDPDRVMAGNGSDELIDLILRLFRPEAGQGGISRVLSCPPTFGMYGHYTRTNDMELIEIPRSADFTVDVTAIEEMCRVYASPQILFVASPNNPDGQLLPEETLLRLLNMPLLVVLDEAYVEFSTRSYVALTAAHDNLIVLRTFSKWAGLAGLRVGYGVFPQNLMPSLWRLKSPYNVNGLAQLAAQTTLEDLAAAQMTVRKIIDDRERFSAKLVTLPFLQVYPSQTNYIFCKLKGISGDALRRIMEAHGIILRYYQSECSSDSVRITIGTPSQNEAVWVALRSVQV